MRSSQGGSTVEKSKEAAEDPSIYGDRASRLGLETDVMEGSSASPEGLRQ